MLNAKKMRDPVIRQTDLDTLMERINDHYLVDEDVFVSELTKVLNSGPHYLQRFVAGQTITNSTAALSSNASLLALGDK